jgi:glucose-1-phosphate thymidylyltransferase
MNIHLERIADDVVGLIPAGGLATRLAPIPCSKEIFPLGVQQTGSMTDNKIKVVSQYLLERMLIAGIKNIYFIIREDKWDIVKFYGDGSCVNMNIGYLILGVPYGTPFTLNQAYPFVKNKIVALGFPDILFSPDDAYVVLLEKLYNSNADAVLGLFRTDQPQKMDMVDINISGKIKGINIKPDKTDLGYTWTIAVWQPSFSEFMNNYLHEILDKNTPGADFTKIQNGRELFVGDVFVAALEAGMQFDTVVFSQGFTRDIGTPEDLYRAINENNK